MSNPQNYNIIFLWSNQNVLMYLIRQETAQALRKLDLKLTLGMADK